MGNLVRHLFLVILVNACSLTSERSFEDIMSSQEEYYHPGRDFRFAVGDVGQRHYTTEEVIERTPSSEKLAPELREQIYLRKEVGELERLQPQIFVEQYDRYREYFSSESEKVYFLRLTSMEDRERFLIDKGIKRAPAAAITPVGQNYSWEHKSKASVWEEYGAPQKVESTSGGGQEKEQEQDQEQERWTYRLPQGGGRTFYFAGDKVKEFQQDRRYP
jgi:hypothetical protein